MVNQVKIICGLDEVGRGALAGPVVLCAVIIPENLNLKSKLENYVFRDSKKISAKQRVETYNKLVELVKFELNIIGVERINNFGIGEINKSGFVELINKNYADEYIVDGNLKFNDLENVTSIIKADGFIDSVMAAGIIAKVTRDRIMHKLHYDFPDYDFLNNVGYGTKKHIQALKEKGRTIHHRDLFLRKIFN